jgi:hypothetical protein
MLRCGRVYRDRVISVAMKSASNALGWRTALGASLLAASLLLIAVPFLASGTDTWLAIDWIDDRKIYSIDDAYRFFAAKNAFALEAVFLWNYVLPLALLFDAALAALTDGDLLAMRVCHAGLGAMTLALIARGSLKAGCGPALALASVTIVGLMPLYLVVSSSFYGEAPFAFLIALAFVLFIEQRTTALAMVIGLSPLVRPEGALFCILFVAYFALRRDALRCTLIAVPGLAYLAVLYSALPDWGASMSWRLELREILSPLDLGNVQSLSFDRVLNPLWGALGLTPLFLRRYRQWWPMRAGPAFIVAIQAAGIWRGVQDYELRYFFALIPIFGISWALPIRSLLDASGTALRRRWIASATALGVIMIVVLHSFQSDWLRRLVTDPRAAVPGAQGEYADKALLFDPAPLRAFAARVDAYVAGRNAVRTVFVADYAPLYFLELVRDDPGREIVLIPHDAAITAYSEGYFFGFSLETLRYGYYRFEQVEDGPAALIVNDSGPADLYLRWGESTRERAAAPIAANVQSGSLKAFIVLPTSRDDVVWSIPTRAAVP